MMNPVELRASVEKVSAEYDASVQARDAETQAEAELLDALVATVKPALRALSSRIRSAYRAWWVNSAQTDNESKYLDARGVLVTSEKAGPDKEYPYLDSGKYSGYDLFLLTDGTWLELEYKGQWSNWQGSEDEWTSKQRILTSYEVASEYNIVDKIVCNIHNMIGKSGSREKATKAAHERAEKLKAITALLK